MKLNPSSFSAAPRGRVAPRVFVSLFPVFLATRAGRYAIFTLCAYMIHFGILYLMAPSVAFPPIGSG